MQGNQHEETTSINIPTEQADVLVSLSEAMSKGDRQEVESYVSGIRQIVSTKRMLQQMEAGTFKERVYMAKEEVDTAYKHALDSDNPTVDDCYSVVIQTHGVTEEYIEESKSNPNRHLKEVVQENKHHPSVKKMQKNNVFDIDGLQKSTTPNQLLVGITNRRSVSDRLDELEAKVESLELRTSVTEARQDSTDHAIADILQTKDHKKNIARGLRNRGVKIKDIMSTLGVSKMTIMRWLAEQPDVNDT